MAVPYIFANTPGGSSLLLSELDANFAYIVSGNPSFSSITLTGNLAVGGTSSFAGPATFNDITINGALTIDGVTVNPTGFTGNGLLVLNNGPTLIAPVLGTPASGNLSNCTGYPVSQVAGLASGVLPFLTNPSSANLAAAVVDETGTGNLVLSNSPTLNSPILVAPALGTPASGNLSGCTNFPAPNLSGVVPVINGGTGLAVTGAVGDVLVVTAPNTLGYTTAPPAIAVAGGAASQILYQVAPNTTAFLPNGVIGQALVSNGVAAPFWGQISLTAAVTGVLPIANGGTNSATQQGAIDNLVGSVAAGTYLRGNGTSAVMSTLQVSDVPILNQNTTGSAATFTSTTQNSQFNSIGVNSVPPGVPGVIRVSNGIQFQSLASQTDVAIGYAQSWQNVTAFRVFGTTYTNTDPRTIMVVFSADAGGAGPDTVQFLIGGVTVYDSSINTGFGATSISGSFIVPAGQTYVLNVTSGTMNLRSWAELR